MKTMDILLLALGALNLLLLVAVLVRQRGRSASRGNSELLLRLGELKGEIDNNLRQLREMEKALQALQNGNRDSLERINETLHRQLGAFQKDAFEKFDSISSTVRQSLAEHREQLHRENGEFRQATHEDLEKIDKTLEAKLAALQATNEEKLEKMRGVVEEKLEKTLNERLRLSFESVRQNLENVQKGLGEMQSLATDVGGLKRAINNVKTRGVFGEVQLERILEQMLTAEQYVKNAQVKSRSQERVEFAIRLPGKEEGASVLLPVDSKFPLEQYDALRAVCEEGDKAAVEQARAAFAGAIRAFAKEISSKYIHPPVTTDFAILFLPFESLYAEVVQTPGLFEELQAKYKITVTGPTTLSAFLNALQMGFKTLAIERRSSEVWNILGAVKTEFKTFQEVLGNVQKKLRGADDELSRLVGTRTNAINRKLRDVDALPAQDARALLPGEAEE